MADRQARLITKRTSVPGKIPTGTTGDESSFIRAGELASNLSDHSLWGYDGANVFEYGSNSFLGLTGGTVNGNLFISGGFSSTTISGGTILSGGTNLYDIFGAGGGTSGNLWSSSTGSDSIIANNGTGNLASGNYSIAIGNANIATGSTSASIAGQNNNALGINSSVIGGTNNTVSGNNSAIIAGSNNFITASRTVILGGSGITGNTDDSVYVKKLNVGVLTGTSVYSLGIDSNGFVVTGTTGTFGITVDAGGSVLTQGVKGFVVLPYNATITGWDIVSNISGDCVVDLWRGNSYNIPTISDTITGTEKPKLTSQQINYDNTLISWDNELFINDVIAFNIISATTLSRITLTIKVIKK